VGIPASPESKAPQRLKCIDRGCQLEQDAERRLGSSFWLGRGKAAPT
jgi:hypothetical protein